MVDKFSGKSKAEGSEEKSHAKTQRRKGDREWTRMFAKEKKRTADGRRFTQMRRCQAERRLACEAALTA